MKQRIMVGLMALLAIAGGMYFPVPAKAAEQNQVIIMEFMANPSKVTDSRGEWIELYNPSSVTIDLTGWDIDTNTISGSLVMEPNSLATICKNADFSLNGGVTCDAVSGFSLGNESDTISLRDQENNVISSFVYDLPLAVEGRATAFSFAGAAVNQTQQYGLGDYGTPSSNKHSHMLVHTVVEKNTNKHPDYFWGEKSEAGYTVNLYKIDGLNGWQYQQSTTTTGKNLPDAAQLSVEPGEYAVCVQQDTNLKATFAKQANGWFTLSENQVTNQSAQDRNDPLCSKFDASAGQFTHHTTGVIKL